MNMVDMANETYAFREQRSRSTKAPTWEEPWSSRTRNWKTRISSFRRTQRGTLLLLSENKKGKGSAPYSALLYGNRAVPFYYGMCFFCELKSCSAFKYRAVNFGILTHPMQTLESWLANASQKGSGSSDLIRGSRSHHHGLSWGPPKIGLASSRSSSVHQRSSATWIPSWYQSFQSHFVVRDPTQYTTPLSRL